MSIQETIICENKMQWVAIFCVFGIAACIIGCSLLLSFIVAILFQDVFDILIRRQNIFSNGSFVTDFANTCTKSLFMNNKLSLTQVETDIFVEENICI